MKLIRTLLLGACAALCLATIARADDGWTQDYDAALAQANATNKRVLIDFTGSDWCPWCVKMDSEVFSTQAFKDYASANLILVKVDFLKKHPQSDEVKARNSALKDKYSIEGFPTTVEINPDGTEVVRQVGYRPGGPDAFIAKFSQKS